MQITLDIPRVTPMKNGTKALSFTVLMRQDNGWPLAVVTNWRVMDGMIHAPASYSRRNRQYYQTCWVYANVAQLIYAKLVEMGWVKQFDLPALLAEEHAIGPIILNAEVARLAAPSLLESLNNTAV